MAPVDCACVSEWTGLARQPRHSHLSLELTLLMLKPSEPGAEVGVTAKVELVPEETAAEELFWAAAKATRTDATVTAVRANMARRCEQRAS